MSGRISPAEATDLGLPEGVYINPDNLPPVTTSHIEYDDDHDIAPARGSKGKKNKFKGMFKKPGKKSKEPSGTTMGISQLGDVLGRSVASSVGSKEDGSRDSGSRHDRSGEDIPPVRHQPTDPEKSKMATFKEFFKKSESHPAPHSTSGYPDQHQSDKHTQNATMDSMRTTVMNFFHGPSVPIIPTSTADVEVAPLNPPPRRSPCRISIVLFVIFGLMVIIGIIVLIMGFQLDNTRAAEHCMVIGPIFIGFGCFLIIGEIFFMMFWVDDPMPCLGDCMEKMNKAIGGVSDPYGLKLPETYQKQRASYYPGLRLSAFLPPESPTAKETIPMKTMYSGAYSSGPTGPATFDAPSGPAALDYNPLPGYKPATSQDSNTSYQNSSYQDDSFTQAGRII